MIWSIIRVIGRQGITLLIYAVLALFLDPKDFGILAMATVWTAFIYVFSELGFGDALIQREKIDSKHFSTIFFINITIGASLTIIGIAISWLCAAFYKTPEVQPIMATLSFGFIISSFSLTQLAISQRKLKFRHLAIREITASSVGGIIGITLAFLKFGVWSLVVYSLINSILVAILLWNISKWRPSLKEFSFQHAKDLWGYSSKIFAFRILKYFAKNSDKLIIGYLLGAVALGIYNFSFRLIVFPISMFVGAIGTYLFPKFSRMQEDLDGIRKSYLQVVKAINSIIAPSMVIVAILSPILVPSIWGEKWISSVPIIQIFALLAILQSFISPVGQLMKALDRPAWLLNWAVFVTITASIFIWIGTHFQGAAGAAVGITVVYIFGIPINFVIVNKLIHIRIRNIIISLLPSILSSFLIGSLLLGILNSKTLFGDIRVIIGLFLSVLLYLVSLTLLDKKFMVTVIAELVKVAGLQKIIENKLYLRFLHKQ